jgi:transposase
MPPPIKLHLEPVQQQELEALRDHAAEPYLRERAAALLKIAAGQSASAVARAGLLKPRYYETVSGWVKRYQAEGLAGLRIRPGRGRKPAFSPSRT